jgi:hypothetical protein
VSGTSSAIVPYHVKSVETKRAHEVELVARHGPEWQRGLEESPYPLRSAQITV